MRRMTRTVVATMAISILAACQTEPATVERTSEVTATVTAIDLPGRLVTLQPGRQPLHRPGARGRAESAAARGRRSRGGPLLPGDRRPAGEAGPGGQCERDGDARAARREAWSRAGAGGHGHGQDHDLDVASHTVSFTNPDGLAQTITVQDPEMRDFVETKVGDEVAVTYTEALALSVEPASP